ncbi:tyrosine-type recombinase/integrase [Bariatricus sp. SGI.154]|uniref:tyrosine-type recombinase/integrase n=1 Tax=Bariatricus sp. SGI.154 TaxID=3420549 RepID=UPI003D011A66
MNSIYASELIKQVIWEDFTVHFKSPTTAASYQTDIAEIMEHFQMDFLQIQKEKVKEYYEVLQNKVREDEIKPGTMAKKFRELHSFAEYICENRERYGVDAEYQDYYYPYLKLVAKQEKYAKSVSIEQIDRLLKAAEEDLMAYCMIVLLYRVGLSSTEITELKPEDLAMYENGVYAKIRDRTEMCCIPEDAFAVLNTYMESRTENTFLFYNRRGNKLNTMYISRLMKKYTQKAGIPAYSAESIRNTCGFTLFSYGADPGQVAGQMGITRIQIKRYQNIAYREELQRSANRLVKIRVEPPVL